MILYIQSVTKIYDMAKNRKSMTTVENFYFYSSTKRVQRQFVDDVLI